LSKDALAGTVPLRTFGQLKQLWEARTEGPPETGGEAAQPFTTASTDHPAQSEPATEAADTPTAAPVETDPQDAANSLYPPPT
jgi:uncharacterized protein